MKSPHKKDDWDYPYSRELHDKFARVYCQPRFSKTEVNVDLIHAFLKEVNKFIDKTITKEKLLILKDVKLCIPIYDPDQDSDIVKKHVGRVAKALRSILKGRE